jgi:hypothetical protein
MGLAAQPRFQSPCSRNTGGNSVKSQRTSGRSHFPWERLISNRKESTYGCTQVGRISLPTLHSNETEFPVSLNHFSGLSKTGYAGPLDYSESAVNRSALSPPGFQQARCGENTLMIAIRVGSGSLSSLDGESVAFRIRQLTNLQGRGKRGEPTQSRPRPAACWN